MQLNLSYLHNENEYLSTNKVSKANKQFNFHGFQIPYVSKQQNFQSNKEVKYFFKFMH